MTTENARYLRRWAGLSLVALVISAGFMACALPVIWVYEIWPNRPKARQTRGAV